MTELIIFVISLVSISSILSLWEVSVLSCDSVKLKTLVTKKTSLKVLSDERQMVATTIIMLNIIIDIVGASYGGMMAFKLFGDGVEYQFYTIGITCLLLYLATLFPKLYASTHSIQVIKLSGLCIVIIYKVLKPIVSIVYLPIKLLFKSDEDPHLSQSELSSVITLARKNKLLNERQTKVISNIIELDKLIVGDLINSADLKIAHVDIDNQVMDLESLIKSGTHKRYVVTKSYNDKLHPIGIVLYRDIVQNWLKENFDLRISTIMHPVTCVDCNDNAMDILEILNQTQDHITVIVDQGVIIGVMQSDDLISAIIK